MQLLTDDNGNAVVRDGKPVYTNDDGNEIELDATKLFGDLKAVNNESASRRKQLEEMSQQLKQYDGIEPEKAREALDMAAKLDGKKMIDAGQVDALRNEMKSGYEKQMEALKQETANRDQIIRQLTVDNGFKGSSFIREKTVLTPDIALKAFGEFFEVGDDLQPIAKIDGVPLMSPSNPTAYATVDEALQVIVSKHPQKDHLLRGGKPGGGDVPRSGNGNPPPQSKPWSKMTAAEQLEYKDQHGIEAAKKLIDAE